MNERIIMHDRTKIIIESWRINLMFSAEHQETFGHLILNQYNWRVGTTMSFDVIHNNFNRISQMIWRNLFTLIATCACCAVSPEHLLCLTSHVRMEAVDSMINVQDTRVEQDIMEVAVCSGCMGICTSPRISRRNLLMLDKERIAHEHPGRQLATFHSFEVDYRHLDTGYCYLSIVRYI